MAPTTRSAAAKSSARLESPLTRKPKKESASESATASKKRKARSPKPPVRARKEPQKKPKIAKAAPKPNKSNAKKKSDEVQNPSSPTAGDDVVKAAQSLHNSLNLPEDPSSPAPARNQSKGKRNRKAKSKDNLAVPPFGLGIYFDGLLSLPDGAEHSFGRIHGTETEPLQWINERLAAQGMPMPSSFSPIERGNDRRKRRMGPHASPTEVKGGIRKRDKDPSPAPVAALSETRRRRRGNPDPMPPDHSALSCGTRTRPPRAANLKPLSGAPPAVSGWPPRDRRGVWSEFRLHAPNSPSLLEYRQPLYRPSTRTLTALAPTNTPPHQTTEGGHHRGRPRPRPQRQRTVKNRPYTHFPPSPSAVARQDFGTRGGSPRSDGQVRFGPHQESDSRSPITPRRLEREMRRLQERLVTSPSEVTAIRRARSLRRVERAGAAMEAARTRGQSQEREAEAEGGSAEKGE